MTFSENVVAGVAQLLADAGVVTWSGLTGQVADSSTPAAVTMQLPETPDRVVVLTPTVAVTPADLEGEPDDVLGLQTLARGAPDDRLGPSRILDAVYDELHRRSGVTLSTGVHLSRSLRTSGTSLGEDTNRRSQAVATYQMIFTRPLGR